MPDQFTSTAEYYHDQTKYRPETINDLSNPDWSAKPDQFKEYEGADIVRLDDKLPFTSGEVSDFENTKRASGELTLEALARILFFTNGVTAVSQQSDDFLCYRAAPSAGALYPTELYALIPNHSEIASGLYNFHVGNHKLQRVDSPLLGPIGDELLKKLNDACLNHAALRGAQCYIIFTTMFLRSSWRYGQRAYRRCMLDTGHVLGNLTAYLPLEGLGTIPLSGFIDQEINDLLGLDPSEESACIVAPILPLGKAASLRNEHSALRSSPYQEIIKPENDHLLNTLARQTEISRPYGSPAASLTDSGSSGRFRKAEVKFYPGVQFDSDPLVLKHELMETILQRRSTRQFSGNAISKEDLAEILEYAYRYELAGEKDEAPIFFDESLLETWVVVHKVSGMSSGVYYYSPAERELKLVDKGDYRGQIYYLTLQQDLAKDAGAVVIHTCNLLESVQKWGNRAYRMIHLDAGHLGQRINLACVAKDLGVSGIGGFFDEEVNSLLYIPEHEVCVYITCIGQPA